MQNSKFKPYLDRRRVVKALRLLPTRVG